jgi:AraC-like DNA-binding protein/quercetin dioxygenase-like cupin family protein
MTIQAVNIADHFEVRLIDQARGCERPHSHTSLVITAVTAGALTLQINDSTLDMTPNQVIAVGPQVMHCVQAFSEDFAGVYVLEVFALPQGCADITTEQWQIFGRRQLTTPQDYASFTALCHHLLHPGSDEDKIARLTDWLCPMLRHHFTSYPFCVASPPQVSPLARAIRALLDHCAAETPPYDEIAAQCGYSKEHCNRLFRRSYHLTMQSYFLNRKANKAKALIDSGMDLAQITLECGFYDQSHFSRVFREIFQISPASYRNSLLASRQSHTR